MEEKKKRVSPKAPSFSNQTKERLRFGYMIIETIS